MVKVVKYTMYFFIRTGIKDAVGVVSLLMETAS